MDEFVPGTVARERWGSGDDAAIVIRVDGQHDLTTAPVLHAALVAAPPATPLIIDLSGCSFADSSIFGALVAHQRARPARALILPAADDAIVRRAFVVLGLEELFVVHATVEQAAEALERVRPPSLEADRMDRVEAGRG